MSDRDPGLDLPADEVPNIYSVTPNGELWEVSHRGEVLSQHRGRDLAAAAVRELAGADRPSQVMITDARGTVVDTDRYDDDPGRPDRSDAPA